MTIDNFDYYLNSVYSTNIVGANQSLDPAGTPNDDIGRLTITVVPEPTSIALLGVAGLGLLTRRRSSIAH